MIRFVAIAFVGCATASPHVAEPRPSRVDTGLARFMRESMSVPFSFAVLEKDGRQRPLRFQRAASVLQDAVRDLIHWADPPVTSSSARDVFYTYARHLEQQVVAFEDAARAHDLVATSLQLEKIRQTCNSCHRFFRPASIISEDVVYDRFAPVFGGDW